ncbi:helix-turn-helix domain-containing protein [Mucilaginibacter gotjawali]|nr:AraC family transcriptional regulator [Mucilaginibacter gotjawali]
MGDAAVSYNGVNTVLHKEQILIIPPNTPFSTRLKGNIENGINERHYRRKIVSRAELPNGIMSDHLFIHFNLGLPYDLLQPAIYTFKVRERENKLLDEIKEYCIKGDDTFDFTVCAAINGLILCLLDEIPRNRWQVQIVDKRVSNALAFIEQHLGERLPNKLFADKANMVENSFARLFKEFTGFSIQQYIKRKRIDKSVILLQHTDAGIAQISGECGFSDRHHFSRVFKEIKGTTPALYKRQVIF